MIQRQCAPRRGVSTLGLTAEHPIPVSLAVPRVAAVVDQHCGTPYWFSGELSSLRPGRGSWMFGSVSDGDARLDVRIGPGTRHDLNSDSVGRLVVFRGALRLDRAARLSVAVIEAVSVDAQGVRLLVREDVRRRLVAEGVLGRQHRLLPEWPATIAVVTAARGAAVEDIRAVVMRRAPWVQLVICDSAVQGRNAPASLTRALTAAAASGAEVVLLTRGGGAAEDLAVFDDELVVRAVAASCVPVVCAVGHQMDRTLCDDVADVSVATPTAAAEHVTPDRNALKRELEQLRMRARDGAKRLLRAKDAELRGMARHAMPAMARLLELLENRLSASGPPVLEQRMHRAVDARRRAADDALLRCQRASVSLVRTALTDVERTRGRLLTARQHFLMSATRNLEHQWTHIAVLSPQRVLDRGYAIVRSHGALCRSTADVGPGATVHIRFADGVVSATITNIAPSTKGRAA